ncbi:MAG: hypothetical protein DRZ79_03980 [Candidatus Cloacimonadota bacterium]|nr:MAG: hypothetical protein DRZ79_03980 [Candidatus Cloacimonadota bacterium]
MNKENFNEIIDFAVAREKEAVKFYQDLQKIAKFQSIKKVLKDFEKMEEGHVKLLENIRTKGFEALQEKEIPNLKISEYMVEADFAENMNYQDILIVAMKREEASKKLYEDMAIRFSDPEIKKLFSRLAVEEAEHKLKFEKLYDEDILKEN